MKIKISATKKIAFIMVACLTVSVVSLGLAIDASVNSSSTTKLSSDQIKYIENEERYENVNFIEGNDKLEKLLETKGRFLLYVGTKACAWCRVSFDIEERVVAQRAEEFADGTQHGIFRNISAAFDGTANGPINDKAINNEYPIYALHDLDAETVSEYHSSGTSKDISDILLGKLENREDIKAVTVIPFKNGRETVLSSEITNGFTTKASAFKSFYDAYANASEFKMREDTSTRSNLINKGTYGTPSWWVIIDGKPSYMSSGYLTRNALRGLASWFLNNTKTTEQLDSEILSA